MTFSFKCDLQLMMVAYISVTKAYIFNLVAKTPKCTCNFFLGRKEESGILLSDSSGTKT